MCTALNLVSKNGENVLGRTLDFPFSLSPHLYAVPQKTKWDDQTTHKHHQNKYRFLGIGQQSFHRIVFMDGVNEVGLAGATLYLPQYTQFSKEMSDQYQCFSSLDFLHYLLGNFNSIQEIKNQLKDCLIIGAIDDVTHTVAPLHWMLTDKTGKSIVIEQTEKGFEIHDNPIGVMTNSPDFQWHLTNLKNYTEISTQQQACAIWDQYSITPFGQASGTSNLPGGYTPPARFVRTAFQKCSIDKPTCLDETINAGFHLLEGVTIPKGVVKTPHGEPDYTQYTSFVDIQSGNYYFKNYDNPQIIEVKMKEVFAKSNTPEIIDLGSITKTKQYLSIF